VALGICHGDGKRQRDFVFAAVVDEGNGFAPCSFGIDGAVLVEDVESDNRGVFLVKRFHLPKFSEVRFRIIEIPSHKVFGLKIHFAKRFGDGGVKSRNALRDDTGPAPFGDGVRRRSRRNVAQNGVKEQRNGTHHQKRQNGIPWEFSDQKITSFGFVIHIIQFRQSAYQCGYYTEYCKKNNPGVEYSA